MSVITFDGVTRRAGGRTILDLPRLSLGEGTTHVQGPVGAGKSTLLKLAATLLRPSTGTVRVLGIDTNRGGPTVRAGVGYVGHEPALASDLTVAKTLRLHARIHGAAPAAIAETVEDLGLLRLLEARPRTLSRGERLLCDLARATLHRPPVLLLDEPTADLDPDRREKAETLLARFRRAGACVVIASHTPPGRAPDRTLRLEAGKAAADTGAPG